MGRRVKRKTLLGEQRAEVIQWQVTATMLRRCPSVFGAVHSTTGRKGMKKGRERQNSQPC
ncbi:MAG: hypothetical protein JSU70_11350 [Phycisphaerales bacterium]|nr:MAG: hypothetical protein JSU70_11350 [Phycisphaerales bacterium]